MQLKQACVFLCTLYNCVLGKDNDLEEIESSGSTLRASKTLYNKLMMSFFFYIFSHVKHNCCCLEVPGHQDTARVSSSSP